MRPKTKNEKLFNEQAKKYGINAFTASQFDKDMNLKKALISFEKSKKFGLEGDFSNLMEFDNYYLEYLEENSEENGIQSKYVKKEEIKSAQNLFDLISPIEYLGCSEYYQIDTLGFIDVSILTKVGDTIQQDHTKDKSIYDKIQKWHKIRKEIDNIKPFIENRFPRWNHASKKEKEQYKEEIRKLISELTILENDTKQLKRVKYFMDNYSGLNKIAQFKELLLQFLQLPRTNMKEIREKIIKLSK